MTRRRHNVARIEHAKVVIAAGDTAARPNTLGERSPAKAHLAAELLRVRGDRSQQVIADACGVAQQVISLWENPAMPHAPNALHIESAKRAGLLDWAEAASRASLFGLHVEPDPEVIDEPEGKRSERVVQKVLDVVLAINATNSDGNCDAPDALRELPTIDQAIATLYEHRAQRRRVAGRGRP